MFKLWHKKVKCWIGGNIAIFQDGNVGRWNSNTSFDFFRKDDIEIVKSTGLRDKKGKIIYEGDYLIRYDGLKRVVSFLYGSFVFTNVVKKDQRFNTFSMYDTEEGTLILKDWEIIGSIYKDLDS